MEILIVSPLASHKPSGGAKRRILNMLRALKRRGHSIHFVYTCHESVDFDAATEFMRAEWDSVHVIPFTGEYVKSQGEDYGVDDWFEPGSGETVTRLCHELKIDLAVIQYVFQSKYCEYIPDHIPTVMDMHDKLSVHVTYIESMLTVPYIAQLTKGPPWVDRCQTALRR